MDVCNEKKNSLLADLSVRHHLLHYIAMITISYVICGTYRFQFSITLLITSIVNSNRDMNKCIFIYVRSDIRAGRSWQSRDHVFEGNLFDKKIKGRMHTPNTAQILDSASGFSLTRLVVAVNMEGSI